MEIGMSLEDLKPEVKEALPKLNSGRARVYQSRIAGGKIAQSSS